MNMKTFTTALLMLLLTVSAFAQKTTPPSAVETLDGIGIGTSIDELGPNCRRSAAAVVVTRATADAKRRGR